MMQHLLKIGDFVKSLDMDAVPQSCVMPMLWYLLRVVPSREKRVEERLRDRGISVYLPKETKSERSTWNRRVLKTVPLFAGVMFVADHDAKWGVGYLRNLADGIAGFVPGMDGDALAANRKTMAEIRAFEARMQLPLGRRKFAVSDRVRAVDGPFAWWEGPVERLDSHGRIRVLLNVMERQVSVEFDETQIESV